MSYLRQTPWGRRHRFIGDDTDPTEQVKALYLRVLEREADQAGLEANVNFIKNGGTIDLLEADIKAGPEYANLVAKKEAAARDAAANTATTNQTPVTPPAGVDPGTTNTNDSNLTNGTPNGSSDTGSGSGGGSNDTGSGSGSGTDTSKMTPEEVAAYLKSINEKGGATTTGIDWSSPWVIGGIAAAGLAVLLALKKK